jgi:hypothetical protein
MQVAAPNTARRSEARQLCGKERNEKAQSDYPVGIPVASAPVPERRFERMTRQSQCTQISRPPRPYEVPPSGAYNTSLWSTFFVSGACISYVCELLGCLRATALPPMLIIPPLAGVSRHAYYC